MRVFIQEMNEQKLKRLAENAGLTPTQWVNKTIRSQYSEIIKGDNTNATTEQNQNNNQRP